MAGVPHQSLSQKIASEFSDIDVNGAQLRRYVSRKYMRKCPNCNKNSIATKWLLLNKSNHETRYCFECLNCNVKIRKQKNIILDLLTDIFSFGSLLIFILAVFIQDYLPSFIYALVVSIVFFIILNYNVEYFAKLKIAEENYCLNGLTKTGAFFALILMSIIIIFTIYFLVVKPYIS